MKLKTIISSIVVALLLASCSTPKNIVYFQDVKPGSEIPFVNTANIKIQPKDMLRILVSTSDERLTEQFNLMGANGTSTMTNNNGSNAIGYTVDSNGKILFPVLGELKVAGLTREEVANMIREELISHELVRDPVVIVSFLNLNVVVLGAVNSPGIKKLEKDKVSILDVIAQSGDLSIDGLRENVMVIRQENNMQKVYEINLLDADNVYSSPVYYMQQDDVVYVTPNNKARRSSTVNGSSFYTPSFWMSMTSFLISLAVIFVK